MLLFWRRGLQPWKCCIVHIKANWFGSRKTPPYHALTNRISGFLTWDFSIPILLKRKLQLLYAGVCSGLAPYNKAYLTWENEPNCFFDCCHHILKMFDFWLLKLQYRFRGFFLLLLSIQQVHVLYKTSLTDMKDENTKQSEAKRSKC